ncbi:hypothetical protein B0H14DRAFT_3878257 [Mycena olivaceomarginata]|nr:hypothetical protein B0H14DRAFT_3878257 [Mycena olivaceomarginata]
MFSKKGAGKAKALQRVESQPCGRVALVTGGNAGLGYTTVLELARHGAKVYMASRSLFAADAAIASLKAAIPAAQVGFLAFDLASLRVAKATADEFLERDAPGYTGFERGGGRRVTELVSPLPSLLFCITTLNHANLPGHFALLFLHTASLPDAHVHVTVSSEGHRAAESPDSSSLKACSNAMNRYGKLSGSGGPIYALPHILFTNELQRRLAGTGIYCLSVHPGLVATTTNIYRGARSAQRSLDLRPTLPPPAGTYASYPWFARFSFLEKYVLAAYLTPVAQVTPDIFTTVGSSAKTRLSPLTTTPRRPAPYAPLRRLLTNLQRAIILARLLEHRPDRIGFDAQDKPHATPPSCCRGQPGGMHTLASVFYIDTNHMYPQERYTMERGVVPAR